MSLRALLVEREDGRLELRSPNVGLWREVPPIGRALRAGDSIGRLEVLGRLLELRAPEGTRGVVIGQGDHADRARRPVGYHSVLLELDPAGAEALAGEAETSAAPGTTDDGALVFRAPSGGRFYARPAPDQESFVTAGAVIHKGHTIALLEVMKTFHRVQYLGDEFPDSARVVRVVPADGDDLEAGDPLLELEPSG